MSHVGVFGGCQILSMREREIRDMLAIGYRSPTSVDDAGWCSKHLPGTQSAVNRFDSQNQQRVPWLVELRAFCSEASVVGLRYVANASASTFRRSVWLLLLLAGAAFTTFQIQNRIRHYFDYPVSLKLRVEHQDEMRFPTVTICNENVLMRSAADAMGNSAVTSSLVFCSTCFLRHIFSAKILFGASCPDIKHLRFCNFAIS